MYHRMFAAYRTGDVISLTNFIHQLTSISVTAQIDGVLSCYVIHSDCVSKLAV